MKFLTTAVGQNILSRYIYMEKPGENPDSSPNPGDGGAKDKPEKKNKNNVGNGQNVPDYKVFRGKEVKRFEDEVQSLKELVGAHMNIPARVDVSNPNLLADIKRSDGSRDGIAEYKPVLIKGVDPNTGMVEIQYGDEGDLHGEIAFSDLAIDRDDLKRRHNIAPSNQSGYPTNAPRQVEYVERHPKIFKRGDVVVSDLGGPHRVYAQKDGKSPLGREVWLQPNQEAVVLMDDSGWAGGSMLIQVGQQQPVWIWKYMKHSRKPIMGKVRSGGPVPPQNQQNQPNFTNYPSNQPYQNPTYNNQYAPRNQQEPRYNNGFQRASYSQPSYPPQVAGQPQFAQQPANTQSASVLNQRINQNQRRVNQLNREMAQAFKDLLGVGLAKNIILEDVVKNLDTITGDTNGMAVTLVRKTRKGEMKQRVLFTGSKDSLKMIPIDGSELLFEVRGGKITKKRKNAQNAPTAPAAATPGVPNITVQAPDNSALVGELKKINSNVENLAKAKANGNAGVRDGLDMNNEADEVNIPLEMPEKLVNADWVTFNGIGSVTIGEHKYFKEGEGNDAKYYLEGDANVLFQVTGVSSIDSENFYRLTGEGIQQIDGVTNKFGPKLKERGIDGVDPDVSVDGYDPQTGIFTLNEGNVNSARVRIEHGILTDVDDPETPIYMIDEKTLCLIAVDDGDGTASIMNEPGEAVRLKFDPSTFKNPDFATSLNQEIYAELMKNESYDGDNQYFVYEPEGGAIYYNEKENSKVLDKVTYTVGTEKARISEYDGIPKLDGKVVSFSPRVIKIAQEEGGNKDKINGTVYMDKNRNKITPGTPFTVDGKEYVLNNDKVTAVEAVDLKQEKARANIADVLGLKKDAKLNSKQSTEIGGIKFDGELMNVGGQVYGQFESEFVGVIIDSDGNTETYSLYIDDQTENDIGLDDRTKITSENVTKSEFHKIVEKVSQSVSGVPLGGTLDPLSAYVLDARNAIAAEAKAKPAVVVEPKPTETVATDPKIKVLFEEAVEPLHAEAVTKYFGELKDSGIESVVVNKKTSTRFLLTVNFTDSNIPPMEKKIVSYKDGMDKQIDHYIASHKEAQNTPKLNLKYDLTKSPSEKVNKEIQKIDSWLKNKNYQSVKVIPVPGNTDLVGLDLAVNPMLSHSIKVAKDATSEVIKGKILWIESSFNTQNALKGSSDVKLGKGYETWMKEQEDLFMKNPTDDASTKFRELQNTYNKNLKSVVEAPGTETDPIKILSSVLEKGVIESDFARVYDMDSVRAARKKEVLKNTEVPEYLDIRTNSVPYDAIGIVEGFEQFLKGQKFDLDKVKWKFPEAGGLTQANAEQMQRQLGLLQKYMEEKVETGENNYENFNAWVDAKGFPDAKLEPSATNPEKDVLVGSFFKLEVEWPAKYKGKSAPIQVQSATEEGKTIEKPGVAMEGVEYLSAKGHKSPILKLETKSGENFYLTRVPASGLGDGGVSKFVRNLSKSKTALTATADGNFESEEWGLDYQPVAHFPQVHLKQGGDLVSLLNGEVDYPGHDGFKIAQAKYGLEFKMDEKGASVANVATASFVTKGIGKKPQIFKLDGASFVLWTEIPNPSGDPIVAFQSHVTQEFMKDPTPESKTDPNLIEAVPATPATASSAVIVEPAPTETVKPPKVEPAKPVTVKMGVSNGRLNSPKVPTGVIVPTDGTAPTEVVVPTVDAEEAATAKLAAQKESDRKLNENLAKFFEGGEEV